uniref:Uncharacterized protein n=1 Tax=Bracon brevicornis TaxID=1563983 RepID=A0A6V7L584_9HYME
MTKTGIADNADEEYIPSDLAKPQQTPHDFEYVPSRKSDLRNLRKSEKARVEEYTPTFTAKSNAENAYVPNSIASLKKKTKHELYEPSGVSGTADEYIPSAKGAKTRVEEYQPDFSTVKEDYNVVYVPSLKRKKKNDDDKDSDRKKIVRKKNDVANTEKWEI